MRLESKKLLYDVLQAADLLAEFTEGASLDDYLGSALLRSAVERQFEIIGEAIGQLSKIDLVAARRIDGYQRIIAFRNWLIHGYAVIDDRTVWDLLQARLPQLREVKALLDDG